MKPVNTKSLIHFLFDQMEKLDKGEITVDQAKAQASIAKQVNNTLAGELERVRTQIKAYECNRDNNTNFEIRNVEGKLFDNEIKA